LDRPLSVRDLAVRAATPHRRFYDELGTTPLAWLTTQRVALAGRAMSWKPANNASTSSPAPAAWAPAPTSAPSSEATPA
jgi:hypothetical protein